MAKFMFVVAVLAAVAAGSDPEPGLMPDLVGQALYPASRAARALGVPVRYVPVSVDTAELAEFHVAGQAPAPGDPISPDSEVVLEFNSPHTLRYWEDWVLPLLGDFRMQVSFYRVQRPPEPISLVSAGYPPELYKYRFSGSCRVEALVDLDGSVLAARLVEPSGLPEADSAALDAALRGRFHPAEHYEMPVRVWFPLPYRFEFKELQEPTPKGPGVDPMLEP